MIEASTQKERFDGYLRAYRTSKANAEQDWHPAWKYYYEVYTRRRDGQPLLPLDDGMLTSMDGAASGWRIKGDTQVAPNNAQAIVRTIVATTLNRDPEFSLDPEYEGFDAPLSAKLAACALNSEWRKRKFNEPIREAYIDSLITGRGWVKTGWQSTFTRPINASGTPKAVMTDAAKAVSEISRRGTRLGRMPFDQEKVQDHMDRFGGKLLVEDHATLRRVSPFDMFFDPAALNPDDARWIANRWRCPLAFAKKNESWSKKNRESLSASGLHDYTLDPEDDAHGQGTSEYEGNDTVWIIDFFDLADGTWCQFAESGEDFLRKPEEIPFPYGQPFVWIENVEDTTSSQPISEIEIIWPHQRDLTNITNELGLDRIQSRTKVLVRAEDAEQLRPVFESTERGLVIPVEMPPGEATMDAAYKVVQGQSNAGTLISQLGVVGQAMTQASGVSDYLRGGPNAGETATEVNAKQQAAGNFMGEKASRVRDFIEACAQRTLMNIQSWSRLDFFTTTKLADPADGQVKDVTVGFGREHMKGMYRVIVSGDSTEEKTPQAKMARAQAIASTAMPFVQAGVVDMGKLFKYVMKEGFGVDDPTGLLTQQAFNPQPPMLDPSGQPQQGSPIGGISMTPGSQAGQLGATAAQERFNSGASVPTPG